MIPLYIYSFWVIWRETDLKRSFFVHAIFESVWYTHVTTQWRQPCYVLCLGHILEEADDCNDFFLDIWNHPSLTPEKILKFHMAMAMCLW
jgi:hypothetical protein